MQPTAHIHAREVHAAHTRAHLHQSSCFSMFSGILLSGTCPGPSFMTCVCVGGGGVMRGAFHGVVWSTVVCKACASAREPCGCLRHHLTHAHTRTHTHTHAHRHPALHLHVLLPRAARELALRLELCKLRCIVGVWCGCGCVVVWLCGCVVVRVCVCVCVCCGVVWCVVGCVCGVSGKWWLGVTCVLHRGCARQQHMDSTITDATVRCVRASAAVHRVMGDGLVTAAAVCQAHATLGTTPAAST
jgi:hypothetical protein